MLARAQSTPVPQPSPRPRDTAPPPPAARDARAAPPSARADALAPMLAAGVRHRAGSDGRAMLQRLIAVNGGDAQNDYALMKQIQQLRATLKQTHRRVIGLNALSDFSAMKTNEDLFIVSHGWSDSGKLKGVETDKLISWLNDANKGVPANFGRIVLLSCYGGMDKGQGALAENISAGLRHRGHRVEGALGFSFGTTAFSKSTERHSSVLSENLRVFYELKADQLDEMANTWGAMNPSHQHGVLGNTVNRAQTIRQNMRTNFGGQADGRIAALIKEFQEEAKRIEERLKRLLPGDTIQASADALQNSPSWTDAIRRQYKLFDDYYLWTDPDAAFQAFVNGSAVQ
jgi:hypothetical protein